MARKKSGGQVYVATEDGHALIDGVEYAFHKGRTRVSEDSVLRKMKAFDTFFEPADEHLHYADAEQATAAPGETRDVMLGEQVGPLEAQTVGNLVGVLTFKMLGGDDYYFAVPTEWISRVLTEAARKDDAIAFWERSPAALPPFLSKISLDSAGRRGSGASAPAQSR
jgi:hypothetical protein